MDSTLLHKLPGLFKKSSKPVIVTPGLSESEDGYWSVLSATELLKPHALLLAQINELAGLSAAAFQSFYQPAINGFARFAQQLPASQRYHHAEKGGLLTHTLEVCVLALKIRRSYLLSAHAGAEEIAKKQDLWTYAVFLAALCHDLAKPVAYQRVEIFSTPGGEPDYWEPYAGFIDEQGRYYRPAFKPGNEHHRHEPVTPLLVSRIIPTQGMQWLSSDPVIFALWLATITGDYPNAEAIGAIISQADVQSVSKNLGGGSPIVTTVKPVSLADKILTTLRHLINIGTLPLNTKDGSGWVKGEDCWLASKPTGDAIRAQLIQEGHKDAPSLNGPLFEALQQYAVLQCGDKALWQITLVGEGWQQDSTALRIPVATLWPDSVSMPEDFTGEVQCDGLSESRDLDNVVTTLDDFEPPSLMHSPENAIEEAVLNPEDNVKALSTLKVNNQPLEFKRPDINPAQPRVKMAKIALDNAPGQANDFIAWLQLSIQQRTILVNNPHALLHVVSEGVFLATPGVFQCYAKAKNLADWKPIQKSVLKKRWHLMNANKVNVFTYQVTGNQKSTLVNGLLFADPAFIFGASKIPKPNPHLTPAAMIAE